jgi:hypothetical protein
VDLRIRRGEEELLVQCKRWQSWPVGVDEIRKLAGTLMREGLRGEDGIFVTLSHFTEPVIVEAAKVGVKLVDNQRLVRRIETVRASEPCPICATPMLLDRSTRGWWLRCPRWADGCTGKRDLGAHPGRALDLLLADRREPRPAQLSLRVRSEASVSAALCSRTHRTIPRRHPLTIGSRSLSPGDAGAVASVPSSSRPRLEGERRTCRRRLLHRRQGGA